MEIGKATETKVVTEMETATGMGTETDVTTTTGLTTGKTTERTIERTTAATTETTIVETVTLSHGTNQGTRTRVATAQRLCWRSASLSARPTQSDFLASVLKDAQNDAKAKQSHNRSSCLLYIAKY